MRAAAFVATLLLSACVHMDVQDIGSGRHSLVAVAPSGGYYGSHEEAVELANEYCSKYRQAAVIESFNDKPEVGSEGEHTSTLVFTCAPPRTLHF